ncbi:heparinase II/III family protein [Orrella sp. 11846]|uniref:heparinase II/III family protein n=1 Tax=Orrella sp. 11846 TaxID=3409913 RepID=UPI003B5C21A9
MTDKPVNKNSIDDSHLVLSDYEIKPSRDLDSEIREYFNQGFVALGRADLPPYKITFPMDWSLDPYHDRNWVFQLHAWQMLDPFLARFSNADIEYIAKVITSWFDYEKTNRNPEIEEWLWYDMAVGLRALKIAYFVLRCKKLNVENPIENVDQLVVKHLKRLMNLEELSSGNHGIFQLNGLMSLAWVLQSKVEWKRLSLLRKASRYAREQIKIMLGRQLGQFGVHTEDSPDYHFFAVQKITTLLKAPWWQDAEMTHIRQLLAQAEIAKCWLVTPAFECVPIGDSDKGQKRSTIKKDLIELWPHESTETEMGAQIDGYAVIRSKPEIPVSASRFVFFQGSFYTDVHKHADDLSFIWQEGETTF